MLCPYETGRGEEKMADVRGLSEKKFEALIGLLLRTGVALAATVVLAGGIFYLTKYGDLKPDYEFFGESRATCDPLEEYSRTRSRCIRAELFNLACCC